MNILIVNNFIKETIKSHSRFKDFKDTIETTIKAISIKCGVDNCYFHIKKFNEIDEVLNAAMTDTISSKKLNVSLL
jgi:hypothetical protein